MKPKHYWNYRIIKKQVGGEDRYAIHEVYYQKGKPYMYTENPVEISAESIEDLKEELEWIQDCLDKPVLTDDDMDIKEILKFHISVLHNGNNRISEELEKYSHKVIDAIDEKYLKKLEIEKSLTYSPLNIVNLSWNLDNGKIFNINIYIEGVSFFIREADGSYGCMIPNSPSNNIEEDINKELCKFFGN